MKPVLLLLALSLFPRLSLAAGKVIVFLGDSLTAGYGLSEDQSYPALIQEMLKRDHLNWRVVNAGVSGDTTAGGLERLNWVLKAKPDLVFVALGANDGLRGLKPRHTEKNLVQIIGRIKQSGARVILAGMEMPLNYGAAYRRQFRDVFPRVAEKEKVPLLPFLLEGVGGRPEFNQADGVHPNQEGARIVAKHVYKFLKPNL